MQGYAYSTDRHRDERGDTAELDSTGPHRGTVIGDSTEVPDWHGIETCTSPCQGAPVGPVSFHHDSHPRRRRNSSHPNGYPVTYGSSTPTSTSGEVRGREVTTHPLIFRRSGSQTPVFEVGTHTGTHHRVGSTTSETRDTPLGPRPRKHLFPWSDAPLRVGVCTKLPPSVRRWSERLTRRYTHVDGTTGRLGAPVSERTPGREVSCRVLGLS